MAIVFRSRKRPKYGNKKVRADGYVFDSLKERDRYFQLRLMEKAGEIKALEVHPTYPFEINGMLVSHYEGDFRYERPNADGTRTMVLEDVKSKPARRGKGKKRFSTRTETYRVKKKLMQAVYGITITEVDAG
ncbi:MAG: DUF1064 domain-containing protein [Deltaproteobacteria bacterium]|nr:MAG: DUF1064 domain-containing protein [Deltaproteobacteria bacterium]